MNDNLVLERNRTEFYLCPFNTNYKLQKYFLLLKIGDIDDINAKVYSK